MPNSNTIPIALAPENAAALCLQHYNIKGTATRLPGELDHNYKIDSNNNSSYILKINRPDTSLDYLDFQEKMLLHIQQKKATIKFPRLVPLDAGNYSFTITDSNNELRNVRLLEWIPGRLWSSVNPKKDELLFSLGEICGEITHLLNDFNHPTASRSFDWDIAQASWTDEYIHLFNEEQKEILNYFMGLFKKLQPQYILFRKSVIHNDANDNNIIVNNDLVNPKVETLIDYGDAAFSQTINDLAVALAYAVMDCPDPLAAALPLVSGYHKNFSLEEKELEVLYVLVAIRLVISVTKSAINKVNEPENTYLQISDQQAWALLYKWKKIPLSFAHYSFRNACGYTPVPQQTNFINWAASQQLSIKDLFPEITYKKIFHPDLSIGSLLLGNFASYKNTAEFSYKMQQLQLDHPDALLAGGYLEARPIYSTASFKLEGKNGTEYRTLHLGMDFWLKENTAIHALSDGEIFSCVDNAFDKDYGPTIIVRHEASKDLTFYTLYGHLSRASLLPIEKGMKIKKGDRLGFIGNHPENGNWPPHLHFQIMLDLLDQEENFPGVCSKAQAAVWSSVCPDPALLLNCEVNPSHKSIPNNELINDRKKHLGKSLSLSYSQPIKMLRGEMQWLMDESGRRYLDTVNNVAHVGHEHPAVIRAGQQQMAVLNTNTRYLHENVVAFAKEICNTLPPELSVIHFVNSGSEANELALRMATAFSGQKDVIALEVGYHGNTGRCIDVSAYKFNGKGGKGKPEHTHIVPLPDSYRGKYRGDYSSTGMHYASHIKEQLEEIKRKGRGVSAFLAESIVSCGGQIVLPDNYLKTAYALVRAAGGVCIADEVQTGFGRVGKTFWGFELQGVVPDIVTMGKPIGNGHPLAAVACTRAIADAFANGMEFFNTFGGNPVSAAIGLEVLKVIREEKLQENAFVVGEYLKAGLRKLQQNFPLIGDVRGEGLFLGIEFVEPGLLPATDKTSYISNRMKEHGVLMGVDGQQNNVLKIKPPICFNKENADETLYYLEKILGENYVTQQLRINS